EILFELFGGDQFVVVTEVNLSKRVAVLVANMAGHVDTVEEVLHVVGASDLLAGKDVAHARLEDEGLLPGRSGLETLGRLGVLEAQAEGDEAVPSVYFNGDLFGLGANLRSLDVMLRQVAMQCRVA